LRFILLTARQCSRIEAPMALTTDEATGEACVGAPDGTGSFRDKPGKGFAEFAFILAGEATVNLWARILAPDTAHDSFYVTLPGLKDGKPFVHSPGTNDTWRWEQVNDKPFRLPGGSHTVRFGLRESGTRLSRILVTTDLSWRPVGQQGP
jgi:hypothetical protein